MLYYYSTISFVLLLVLFEGLDPVISFPLIFFNSVLISQVLASCLRSSERLRLPEDKWTCGYELLYYFCEFSGEGIIRPTGPSAVLDFHFKSSPENWIMIACVGVCACVCSSVFVTCVTGKISTGCSHGPQKNPSKPTGRSLRSSIEENLKGFQCWVKVGQLVTMACGAEWVMGWLKLQLRLVEDWVVRRIYN